MINKLKGGFFGLPIGDALGTTLEFSTRDSLPKVTTIVGGGPFWLNAGEFTDDTSMAIALADSLIVKGEFDPNDIMSRFVSWYKKGYYSTTGICFDIGGATRAALENYIRTGNPYSGSTDDWSSGNGAIMRMYPIMVKYRNNFSDCLDYSIKQSELTHGSVSCVQVICNMATLIYKLVHGVPFNEVEDVGFWKSIPRKDIRSSGYVHDSYNAALWSISNTDNFEDALILAVNLADDSDTVGAITGQIAGSIYGYDAIPKEWLEKLYWKSDIEKLFYNVWGV